MFIDILQFKVINNACGYDAGDQFLSELARRLTNFLPPGTLIGAWAQTSLPCCWTRSGKPGLRQRPPAQGSN
ncbi:GGDEF domain-containing protein [Halopseudomonas pachastrellae]|nr:GGDEF domain-containing protein [Halopseudomonas pachastrellae]